MTLRTSIRAYTFVDLIRFAPTFLLVFPKHIHKLRYILSHIVLDINHISFINAIQYPASKTKVQQHNYEWYIRNHILPLGPIHSKSKTGKSPEITCKHIHEK